MTDVVIEVLIAMAAVLGAGWAYQRKVGNAGWSDVFWTFGTGIICAAAALFPGSLPNGAGWRHLLIAALLLLWSFRLGLHVAQRVARSPEDIRYADVRKSWGRSFQIKMFGLLIVQAPITALLSIAIIFAARQPDPHFRMLDGIGIVVMLVAIAGETLADRQMKQFKATHHGHEQVCDRGLWSISRHPNYLFELLGWFSYPIIGLSADRWSLLTLLAPALMFIVLRYLTGVPALEAAMLRRKGRNYAEYQSKVGVIFPKF
jgi:steroid 5-alpha reductase family enzyme